MHAHRAREILDRASTQRFLILGDLILDEFLWGDVSRISPEAPVPVVRLTGESWYPGGAANVARNVREFSRSVGLMGLAGDDSAGGRLVDLLAQTGIETQGILREPGWSTIVKTRIIARHQQLVRVDRERVQPLDDATASAAVAALHELANRADALIVSDYAKGFLGRDLSAELRRVAGEQGKIVTVDPSPSNPLDWSGVTAIKPNRSEALRAAGIEPDASAGAEDLMRQVGFSLLDKWRTRLVLLTLGEAGMLLFEKGQPVYHTPTRAREVFDVSGAGDTAIAVFTVALRGGATAIEAAELANEASGIVVGKLGTATCARDELLQRFQEPR